MTVPGSDDRKASEGDDMMNKTYFRDPCRRIKDSLKGCSISAVCQTTKCDGRTRSVVLHMQAFPHQLATPRNYTVLIPYCIHTMVLEVSTYNWEQLVEVFHTMVSLLLVLRER